MGCRVTRLLKKDEVTVILLFVVSFYLKELELYKEELQTKPALLAVNKMDLPDAPVKLHELMKQLQKPQGEVRSLIC